MTTWLVTGGAGFIGTNLVRLALSSSPERRVVVLDALTYAGRRENLSEFDASPRFCFVHDDICRRAGVEAVLERERPEAILHLAAESHVDRSIHDASPFLRTNVVGTQVLLDAARRFQVPRFLHVSTDEVYGSFQGAAGGWDESAPLAPNSPYAASKAASDLLVRAAFHTHGQPVVITRSSNNYGPYQHPEKLIPLAIANAQELQPIPLYGSGAQVRNWIHVEDHCRGILQALERGRPGEVYHLGGDAELDNRSLLQRLLRILDRPLELIQPVPDRPGHDFRYALDSARARQELGWQPQIDLAAGLEATVAWYRHNQDWLAQARDGAYRQFYRSQYPALQATEAG